MMSFPLTLILACILPTFGLVLLVGSIFFLRSEVSAPRLDLSEWVRPHAKSTSDQGSSIGFSPGSIGEVSSRIGYDVRDLLMAGFTRAEISSYSNEQIMNVIDGRLTLAELRKQSAAEG